MSIAVRLLVLFTMMILATPIVAKNNSIVPTNMQTAANTTKPGCPRTCGNLTIPYPFGVKGCNLNGYYEIVCNTSYNPPRAQIDMIFVTFYSSKHDILNISETQLMIRADVASVCYDSGGNVVSDHALYIYINPAITISYTSNKLVVVGCHHIALFHNGSVVSGCFCKCDSSQVQSGICTGYNGCCQSPIPKGLEHLYTYSSKESKVFLDYPSENVSGCSHVFVAGDDSFNFAGAPDFAGKEFVKRVANEAYVVFDWVIRSDDNLVGNFDCRESKNKNDTTFACQSNTQCLDTEHNGYRCQCLSGYEGNPYIGCTDVDECLGGSKNPCSMICLNTPGSYQCSCPTGYYGDGYKYGTGCIKISSNSSAKLALGLGVSLGSILFLLFGWWFSLVIKRRRIIKQKAKYFERNGGLLLKQKMSSDEDVVQRIKIFTIHELDKATDHFNEDRILGQGGQGTVYKGMLAEGKIVAIKKSKLVEESHIGDFINEVAILSQINHRNIVKLLGCCLETEIPLLVYEFIPNGTLFQHIHHPSDEFQITWKMRLQIASDSAGALTYLHSSSSIPIFHRDIKSSNILLDNKYRAKLSDFGTSRSTAIDQTHVTTRVMGTLGYLDPEYFLSSQFTEKSDVYSFGVVLVELLTGQKAIRTSKQGTQSLTVWFLHHMDNTLLMDVIDSQIMQDGSEEEFLKVAILAKRCLESDGKRRPTMKEVLLEIEAIMSHHLPKTNEENKSKFEQPLVGANNSFYNGYSSTRTFLENNSSTSAEVSLLFNPR